MVNGVSVKWTVVSRILLCWLTIIGAALSCGNIEYSTIHLIKPLNSGKAFESEFEYEILTCSSSDNICIDPDKFWTVLEN